MEWARPSKLLLVACVVLLFLSPYAAAKLGERTHSDEEVQQDFIKWTNERMEQHEAAAAASTKGITGTPIFAKAPKTVTITVDKKKGKGDFRTIRKAVKSLPDDTTTRFIIKVNPGVYKEKLKIPKGKGPITLLGSGSNVTKITNDDTAASAGGTLKSSSVKVYSDNFIAKDIAFENTAPSPPPGAVGAQAVAFMIAGDKAAFYRCAFLGYQDTLYDRLGRHYFQDCYIRGTIDFIFGNGQSLYKNCYLDSQATTFGSLSAQKRELSNDTTGYSFVDCIVNGPSGYIYLGRAWGMYSRVVFIRTYLPVSIRPEGWFDWAVPGRSKLVFYGEYQCYGPGSERKGREVWSYALTARQAKPFMSIGWIDGQLWLPKAKQ